MPLRASPRRGNPRTADPATGEVRVPLALHRLDEHDQDVPLVLSRSEAELLHAALSRLLDGAHTVAGVPVITVAELLNGGPGECVQCKQHAAERMTVALIERNSAPGASVYACEPCARRMAGFRTAPAWLAEDIARLDAATAAR
jgi:hypothetical protein